jgi:ankyrin repeat protein
VLAVTKVKLMRMIRIGPVLLMLLICFGSQQQSIDEEFLKAVENKDIPKINALLKQGANINAREHTNGYFALQYAINWPDVALVKLLLDKGADVNLADTGGTTALIDATRNGGPEYTAIVKLLIERGANVHADNDAAILRAAEYAAPETVRLLLSKGAHVDATDKDSDGDTVLMKAASGASVAKVEMLLSAGAEINVTNEKGQTALMKAVTLDHRYGPKERLPIIELLLKKGANVNARDTSGMTPLLHSVVQYMSEAGGVISHVEVVQFLLDHGADVRATDEKGDTALIKTVGVFRGSPEIVRGLLAKGVQVNAQNKKGTTALMLAAYDGKEDVATLLLEKGADPNLRDNDGLTALDYSINNGQIKMARTLFGRSSSAKHEYKSESELLAAVNNAALLSAVTSSNLADVKTLLAGGANIETRSRANETPLMLAVQYSYGRNEITNYLIEKGADLNAVDPDGNTALMLSINRNNGEAVKQLLAHQAAVGVLNNDRQSALHIAAAGVRAKFVAALLATKPSVGVSSAGTDVRGVEVDGLDAKGRTPLMLAADNEGFVPDEVMELLLSNGAQINAQDPEGNTPLLIATRAGSMSGVAFLISKGARIDMPNKAGETALKIAKRIHENKKVYNAALVEERIVGMLVAAGAKE